MSHFDLDVGLGLLVRTAVVQSIYYRAVVAFLQPGTVLLQPMHGVLLSGPRYNELNDILN